MRRSIGLLLVLGLGVSLPTLVPAVTATDSPAVLGARQLYTRLQMDAARGDSEAQAAVDAIDRYVLAQGLSIDALPVPESIKRTLIRRGGMDLDIHDAAPWSIAIRNNTRLETIEAVRAYIAARHDALHALAAKAPTRLLTVTVTAATFQSASEFAAVLRRLPKQIMMDAFFGDRYVLTSGRTILGSEDWTQAEMNVRQQIDFSLDQFPGVSSSDLRLTVRSVRLDLEAADAERLASDSRVLLVDAIDDIADEYSGQAAVVSVGAPPDIFRVYAREVLAASVYDRQLSPERVDLP